MLNNLVQLWIVIFTSGYIIFFTTQSFKNKQLGNLCGIVAQPAWIYTGYYGEPQQWGVVGLSIFYFILFVRSYYKGRKDETSRL